MITDKKNKNCDLVLYRTGFDEGYVRGRSMLTTQLVNIYYNSYKWYQWRKRDKRLKAFINELWDIYGLTEENNEMD